MTSKALHAKWATELQRLRRELIKCLENFEDEEAYRYMLQVISLSRMLTDARSLKEEP